jgi:hypothetical protein
LRLRVIARLVEHLGQRNRGERDAGSFFEQGSASTADENGFENIGPVLAGVKGQRRVAK